MPTEQETIETRSHWQEMQIVQSNLNLEAKIYPTQVVRRANEEISGEVFQFVERLFGYEDYVPDLQPHEVDARTRALADVCLMMFNSNEFVYVY